MAFHSNRSIYNTLNVLLNAPGDSFLSWATVSRRSLKFDNADDDEVLAKLKRLVEQLESPFDFVRLQGLHGLNNAKRALDDWFVAKTLYPLLQISLGKTPNPTVRAVYYSLKSYAEDYYTLYTQLKDDQAYRNLLTSSLLDNSTPLRERRRIVEEPSNTGRISEHDILLQLRILGSSLSTKVSGILHPIVNAVTTILSQSPDDDFRHGMHWLFNAYNLGYEEVSTSQISLRRKADFHCYIVNFPKPMINPGNRNIHRPDINAHKTLEIPSISGNGHFVDGCKVFEIPSVLGSGHLVNALGDYCAKRNFMKEEYAKQLRLQIDRQATSSVTIGSGKQVVTTGVVKTSFRFKDEKHEYSLLFHILPSCVHDVILGKGFLKITKTFSNLANKARRVKERLMKGMPLRHLLYLGESAPRFQGLINGVPQEALADSGSKVMVMDENYAEEMGLRIVRGSNHQTRLRFADGSTSLTSGMALGVEWEFGRGGVSDRFLLDFHILKNAPANVILSDQFLFGTEAFSHYECFLVDDDDEDDDEAFFFAIDVDETSPGQVHLDMSSLSNKQHAETVLRGEKEDEIANLPRHQQAEAWRRELERRGRWEQDFAALQLCLSTLMQTNSTSLSSSSSSTSGASAQLLIPVPTTITKANTAGMKRPKWRLKFRRKSST
ncbi:uncharacterized protein EI97DRAFT_157975 [Westerdykella ornata]|uniref:Uncharacterized protein n=1 Tax=Westerdykella ornata TaxID=318751 RepID=A0A6A6JCT5_WESOR|nr:uncharacterized protein EI97DRAFT_157975 [Westerdykella ornata]KAF2273436.1 hypothetical protein EI97DRAFT_157975 [Westerdykella ornata]